MTSPAAITFAIPYYSNLGYLREAIDSVLAQTISNWEMIVVDDAGPEPAADLVAALNDPRINYVRNDVNLGLAGNWNECLRHVTTPYVTLLHSDDRLFPRYTEAVLAAADNHPDAAAVFTSNRSRRCGRSRLGWHRCRQLRVLPNTLLSSGLAGHRPVRWRLEVHA